MQRLMIFIGSMNRGGAERVISHISKYYVEKRNWSVDIVMLLHSRCEYELASGINIIDIHSDKGIKKGILTVLKRIKKTVNERNPDVILSFAGNINMLVGLALGKSKIPVIMSERNDPSVQITNIINRKLIDRAYRNASCVVFQTERVKGMYSKDIQNHSVIVPNPISVSCTRNTTQHRIVTAGRLKDQKNHKMLINAFATVVKKHPEYELDIYGKGELKNQLQEQIEELSLANKVHLKGSSVHLHEDIQNAEIFVLSSNFEGLSNALLEAMLMGFPVISTNCAGSDEYIENDENGLLVPIKDEQTMIVALNQMIENNDKREKMGVSARNSVSHLKVDNIMEKWCEVIETKYE